MLKCSVTKPSAEFMARLEEVRTMLRIGNEAALLAYMAGDVDSAAAEAVTRARARRKTNREDQEHDR